MSNDSISFLLCTEGEKATGELIVFRRNHGKTLYFSVICLPGQCRVQDHGHLSMHLDRTETSCHGNTAGT